MDKEKKQIKEKSAKGGLAYGEKNKNIEKKKGRFLRGVVVSDKMDKTIVVLVNRYKEHPKYGKRYKISKKYKAHDEKNQYKKGDKVIIQECPPVSKDKKWRAKL